jgi:hypothetical protein
VPVSGQEPADLVEIPGPCGSLRSGPKATRRPITPQQQSAAWAGDSMQLCENFLRVKAHHHHRRDVRVGQVLGASQTSLKPLDLHPVMVSPTPTQFERIPESIDANHPLSPLREKNRVATTPTTQVEDHSRSARIQPIYPVSHVGIGGPQGGRRRSGSKLRDGKRVRDVAHLVTPRAELGGHSIRQLRFG